MKKNNKTKNEYKIYWIIFSVIFWLGLISIPLYHQFFYKCWSITSIILYITLAVSYIILGFIYAEYEFYLIDVNLDMEYGKKKYSFKKWRKMIKES